MSMLVVTSAGPSLRPGWYWFAGAVSSAIIVAEYQGPIIGIAFAMTAAASAIIWIRDFPAPRVPSVGFLLIGLLVLGLVAAVGADLRGVTVANTDVERDVGTVISYLVFLSIGYFFAYNRDTFRVLMIAIVAAGVAISLVQLVKAGIVISEGVADLYLFRLEAGRGSQSQVAGLCACLVLLQDGATSSYRKALIAAASVCSASMLAVLGRGLMADLIVIAMVMLGMVTSRKGWLVPNCGRMVALVACVVTATVSVYAALRITMPGVKQFIDDFFVTKLQNSVREVSATGLETRSQIAANYRAFELDRTYQQFQAQPMAAQWLGQGWGSTVDFGFETAGTRATFSRTNAPFLHNGYANYLMKVGIIGVVLYVVFLWSLIIRSLAPTAWSADEMDVVRRKVLLAAALVLTIGGVAGGGLGFPAIYFGIITLIGACWGPVWGHEPAGESR